MRELNRLGVTGAIDAGGGFQNYPEDYAVIQKHALTKGSSRSAWHTTYSRRSRRLKRTIFSTGPGSRSTSRAAIISVANGAGEMLVFSAADFEDFRVARPDMPAQMESELEDVVRILVKNQWPAMASARDLRRDHLARARCL